MTQRLSVDSLENMEKETRVLAGERILDALKKLHKSQAELCREVPWLSATRLNNWITGTRMIGLDEAKKLAPILRVNAAYILTIDDSPGDPQEEALLNLYRNSDERGQRTIFRVAEEESKYVIDGSNPFYPSWMIWGSVLQAKVLIALM